MTTYYPDKKDTWVTLWYVENELIKKVKKNPFTMLTMFWWKTGRSWFMMKRSGIFQHRQLN